MICKQLINALQSCLSNVSVLLFLIFFGRCCFLWFFFTFFSSLTFLFFLLRFICWICSRLCSFSLFCFWFVFSLSTNLRLSFSLALELNKFLFWSFSSRCFSLLLFFTALFLLFRRWWSSSFLICFLLFWFFALRFSFSLLVFSQNVFSFGFF